MILICRDCNTSFDEDRAARAVEYMDDMYDRPLVPVTSLLCPFCGSDFVVDEIEYEQDKEDMEA